MMMRRVAFGHCNQQRLTLPPSHFCSNDASKSPDDTADNNDTLPHQAAKRIARKAALTARTEKFYRYVQEGIGALQAHKQADEEYPELVERFTRMAVSQQNAGDDRKTNSRDPTSSALSKDQRKRLEVLNEHCKATISLAIKKDFATTYHGEAEKFQRRFIDSRAEQKLALDMAAAAKGTVPVRKLFSSDSSPPTGYQPLFDAPIDTLRERPLHFWRDWDERRSRIVGQSLGPTNAFEEQIQWTDRGMLWPYPIDNAFMAGEEEKVSFVDHVFLEPELAKYKLPRTGPIAHFMELVVNGLSNNPYMSVQKKHDHLAWYATYFTEAQKGKYKELFN